MSRCLANSGKPILLTKKAVTTSAKSNSNTVTLTTRQQLLRIVLRRVERLGAGALEGSSLTAVKHCCLGGPRARLPAAIGDAAQGRVAQISHQFEIKNE